MRVQTDSSGAGTPKKGEEEESFLACFHSLFHLPRIGLQLSIYSQRNVHSVVFLKL